VVATVYSNQLCLSVAPWVLFTVVPGRLGHDVVGWTATVAALLSVVLAARSECRRSHRGRRRTLKVIDAAGIVTFGAVAAAALSGDHWTRQHLVDYGRAECAGVLAAVMLGSLLLVPLTEQYAREAVPPAYWRSPVYRSLNRHITAALGVTVLLTAVSLLIAGWLESRGELTGSRNLVLSWLVPIILIVAAIGYIDRVRGARADV
jgi:hypothetical protein